jgi:sterol 14-demethylase
LSVGRHRCIGEHFAYIQNKVIVASIINEFDLELVGGDVPRSDFTQLIVLPVKGSLMRLVRRKDV